MQSPRQQRHTAMVHVLDKPSLLVSTHAEKDLLSNPTWEPALLNDNSAVVKDIADPIKEQSPLATTTKSTLLLSSRIPRTDDDSRTCSRHDHHHLHKTVSSNKNPWLSVPPVRCNRNPAWDRKLRIHCAKHYGALKWTLRHGTQLQCSVTGLWAPWESVVDAHLVPEAIASCSYHEQQVLQLLDMTNAMVEEPCNQMPLLETIEVAYQQQQLCFVLYNEQDDSLQDETRYTIRLLDPQLASQTVHCHNKNNTLTFAQLQGKPFALPVRKKNQPLARCLSLHAQFSFQRAKQEGWMNERRPVEYGSPLDTDWIEVPATTTSLKNVSSRKEPRTRQPHQHYCGYETDSLSLCSLEG